MTKSAILNLMKDCENFVNVCEWFVNDELSQTVIERSWTFQKVGNILGRSITEANLVISFYFKEVYTCLCMF